MPCSASFRRAGGYTGFPISSVLVAEEKKKIVLYYTGESVPGDLAAFLKGKLPRYMIPNVVRQLDAMPYTPNGKLDRKALKSLYEESAKA